MVRSNVASFVATVLLIINCGPSIAFVAATRSPAAGVPSTSSSLLAAAAVDVSRTAIAGRANPVDGSSVRVSLSIASTRKPAIRRVSSTSATRVLPAAMVSPVALNFARGVLLKCLADLTGGLPLEVWKSSVVLEHVRARRTDPYRAPPNDFVILRSVLSERGGLPSLWSGLAPRMIEGIFSGGILLAAKEGLHAALDGHVAPFMASKFGLVVPPLLIGFVAGAGGGAAQAVVMGPTSLIVTACVQARARAAAEGIDPPSEWDVTRGILRERGVRGLYAGAPAVAMRQATNWASRQGFTECLRPHIPLSGAAGELVAGCLGGALSAWNTPFEVARIESQSRMMSGAGVGGSDEMRGDKKSLMATMSDIAKERGVKGLYVGLLPRMGQACYQTIFLVCVPRLLNVH